jgi:hypothetical protein
MIGSSSFDVVILSIIIGTLFAIVYSLRILVMLERRIANMDLNIQRITERVAKEELEILREEKKIESKLGLGKKKK